MLDAYFVNTQGTTLARSFASESERADCMESEKRTGMPVKAEKRKMADSRERKKESAPARKKLPIEPLRKLNRLLGGHDVYDFECDKICETYSRAYRIS